MHHSSRLKFECFVETYIKEDADLASRSILDVGSRQVKEEAYSYRQALDGLDLKYTGLDLEAGFNVDIVPANPYIWDEIENETFDYVISGQAFEHNPFMWITTAEIARVLKPGGAAFIIAPSAGGVHRFPFDCWRYYPDSWAALAALTQLDLVESIREPVQVAETIRGGQWMDSVAILRKQPFVNPAESEDFYANLALIVAPFKIRRYDVVPAKLNEGPCYARYMETAQRPGAKPAKPGGIRQATAKRAAARGAGVEPGATKHDAARERRQAARRAARRQARASGGQ